MQKYTIKEIAELAGVSPAAVSLAINNRPGISDATRAKILELVDKLNYVPNPSSRRLLFNRTDNIAVLSKENSSPLEHFFHSELNQIVLKECNKLGFNLIYTSVCLKNTDVVLPKVIKTHDVDGIISYGDIDPVITNRIKEFDIPYVLVDAHYIDKDTINVMFDYTSAAISAMNYLLSIGHRKIAYIGSSISPQFSQQTLNGYRQVLEQNKINIPAAWLRTNANDEKSAYNEMLSILECGDMPTAVFCNADIYAINAIKCAKEHGIDVPNDISVIGIDDIILSAYIDPPLTTVRINKEELAKAAITALSDTINNKEQSENISITEHKLIVRKSTKAI
jgi:DNA-binding LacI/PurR family transcriptional regulator